MGNSPSKNTFSGTHPVVQGLSNNYGCTGVTPIATEKILGTAEAFFDGQRFGGPLYRNSPVSNVANFGSPSSPDGGDYQQITLSADNMLRGAGFSAAAKDTIVLAAWMPDLGVSGVYLPRCVRYSESSTPNGPANPGRRKAFGPDGILLAAALSQDTINGATIGSPAVLNAAGIAGCLGSGYGVPMARIFTTGTSTFARAMGGIEGVRQTSGFPHVLNRVVDRQQMSHSGGISLGPVTSSTPTVVTNSGVSIDVVLNDVLEITWGPLYCSANSALNGEVQLQITEDVGVSNVPVVTKTIILPDTTGRYITVPIIYTVTKTGTLGLAIYLVSADNSHMVQLTTPLDEFGTYTLTRPV
jgi:hypothetical protein